jgi:hypothetical protein
LGAVLVLLGEQIKVEVVLSDPAAESDNESENVFQLTVVVAVVVVAEVWSLSIGSTICRMPTRNMVAVVEWRGGGGRAAVEGRSPRRCGRGPEHQQLTFNARGGREEAEVGLATITDARTSTTVSTDLATQIVVGSAIAGFTLSGRTE